MSSAPLLPGFPPPEPAPFEPWVAVPRRAIRDPQITDLDRTVLALLVDLTGHRIDFTTTPNEVLAKELGVDEDSLRRCLRRLEAAGYIHRARDRHAGAAHRRIDLKFRCWDPPKGTDQKSTGGAPAPTPCTPVRRALAPGKPGASAQETGRQRPPLFLIGNSKELKSSKADGAPAPGEADPGDDTPAARGADQAPARDPAEPTAPPDPEEVAQWYDWLRTGLPFQRHFARHRLTAAGLPVPEETGPAAPPPAPPAQPAQADPSGEAIEAREQQEPQLTPPEAARTAQDGPGSPRDDREAQSIPEPARAQSEPRQAGPPRPPASDLPDLPAVNWAAMMQRCAQIGDGHGAKARTLVGEDLLRAWVRSGDAGQLEGVLNVWSAHWRDWQRISHDHWRSCLLEIRAGLVTVDEVLGVLADAERRGVEKRANYFSHHLGHLLALKRQERAQKAASPAKS